MLKFKCVNTGSLGNMYILNYNGEQLIIDFGVSYNEFLLGVGSLKKVVGGLITHYHEDHANKSLLEKVSEMNIKILSNKNTQCGLKYKLGSFTIYPFDLVHNIDCRGYLIKTPTESVFFCTDTSVIPKINLKIDFFVAEVNFIEQIRENLLLKNSENAIHLNGIHKNHCSLETAIKYFDELNYKPQKIITIHKSNSGLFSQNTVINELSRFAENGVYVAEKNTEFLLEEI